jgi:hypothetical protein
MAQNLPSGGSQQRSFAVWGQTANMPHVASLRHLLFGPTAWHFAIWPTGRLTAKRGIIAI